MKNFSRALRIALRFRLTLVGIAACSALIAVFSGANIGTVYPFVEVVFEGDSMHQWVDHELRQTTANITRFEAEVAELNQQLADADDRGLRRQLSATIAAKESRIRAEQQARKWAVWAEPRIKQYLPATAWETLVWIVVFLVFATGLKNLVLVGNMMLVARLGELTTLHLRSLFFRRTLQMELSAFGQGHTSSLMSRFTVDLGSITGGVGTLFGRTLREPLKMLACLIGAAFISWRLLLLSFIVAPVAFFVTYQLALAIKRANRRAMEESAIFYNRLAESFTGIQAVKAYTMERFERNRYLQTIRELFVKSMRITFYNSLTRMNTELLGVGIICLAILGGGYLVISQETHILGIPMTDRPLSAGKMMVFFAFLVGVSDPIRKMADVFSQLQRAAAAADRVYPMLDRQPTITDPPSPKSVPTAAPAIIFDNVGFHYATGNDVLQSVNLKIAAGETVALVGPNGCGKSTLINLIPRFYDPVEGAVQLDYTDLREMRVRELRLSIGVVAQNAMLFDMSIRENIRYGSPLATDDQVEAAAKKAHAHSFICSTLKDGYETLVGERGGRLSGGQRQRVALARAILRDPKILILDEATSQVDPESEQLIHAALADFTRDRTTLLITHRQSTLALADRVVVMEEGRILDVGAHAELLQRSSLYKRLYQFGLRQTA